jgi:hypothetical protein
MYDSGVRRTWCAPPGLCLPCFLSTALPLPTFGRVGPTEVQVERPSIAVPPDSCLRAAARSRDERPGRTAARHFAPAERRRQGGQGSSAKRTPHSPASTGVRISDREPANATWLSTSPKGRSAQGTFLSGLPEVLHATLLDPLDGMPRATRRGLPGSGRAGLTSRHPGGGLMAMAPHAPGWTCQDRAGRR